MVCAAYIIPVMFVEEPYMPPEADVASVPVPLDANAEAGAMLIAAAAQHIAADRSVFLIRFLFIFISFI